MTDKNKVHELFLKKTTLRVLNVAEFPLVGGADYQYQELSPDDSIATWIGDNPVRLPEPTVVSYVYLTTRGTSATCPGYEQP